MRQLDIAIFRFINDWPDSSAPFWQFLSDATKKPAGLAILGVIVALMLWRSKESRLAVVLAVAALALANETTDLMKAAWPIARPCMDLKDIHLRTGLLSSYGTASAHSANMAAVAAACTVFLGRWGTLWIPVAILVGLSRIYLGVHYPSQVLAGWLVGALWGYAIAAAVKAIVERRAAKIEAASEPVE